MNRFGCRSGFSAGTIALLAMVSPAFAQTINIPGQIQLAATAPQFLSPPQPGRARPLPEAQPVPDLDFTIQSPRKTPVPRAVEELSFPVKGVKVTGAKAYSENELQSYVAPLIGRTIHLSELLAAAERIEGKYRADGFVLSRAYVPTQSVSDGVFRIAVIEGYVAAVSVRGGDESTRRRVEALLAPVAASKPLRLSILEAALLAANQLPGIGATGLLRPSATEPGASDLVVTLTQAPMSSSLSLDNRGAQNTGRWTLSADTVFASPLEDGGQASLSASADPGNVNERWSLQGKYVLPVSFIDDATASLSALYAHGQPGGTVKSLNLITNNVSIGPRLTVPLVLERAEKLSLDGGVTYESADVKGLGSPLSHDEWRVADLAATYQGAALIGGSSNATLGAAQGIPAFGATKSDSAGTSRPGQGRSDFSKFSLQFIHVHPIDGPWSVSLTIVGQYSLDTLLTGEEVSFGGPQVGRGYDPASITGDSGIGAASEIRYDAGALAYLGLDNVQLYGFYDLARVWNHTGSIPDDHIASTGFGARTQVLTDYSVGLEFADALIAVPGNDLGRRSSRVMLNSAVRF